MQLGEGRVTLCVDLVWDALVLFVDPWEAGFLENLGDDRLVEILGELDGR